MLRLSNIEAIKPPPLPYFDVFRQVSMEAAKMKRLVFLVLGILAGCSSPSASEQAETAKRAEAEKLIESMEIAFGGKPIAERAKDKAREEELRASIRSDPDTLAQRAVVVVRKSAEQHCGTLEANVAEITAEPPKTFGDSRWKVTGTYRSPDAEGKPFQGNWTVTYDLQSGELLCKEVEIKSLPREMGSSEPRSGIAGWKVGAGFGKSL